MLISLVDAPICYNQDDSAPVGRSPSPQTAPVRPMFYADSVEALAL